MVDILFLAVPAGTAWLAAALSFDIGLSAGIYPDLERLASMLLLLSVLSFVATLILATRLLMRTLAQPLPSSI